jgi:tetratricopeptide (TPR) repeat protein
MTFATITFGFAVALALQPWDAMTNPQMSRAPEIAACRAEAEPASPPICEAPETIRVVAHDDKPKSIATMTPFDHTAPCPAEAPFFVPPSVARQALPRCAAFVASQPPGSRELATALGRQGFLQFTAGDHDQGRATLEKALAIDPDNLIALLSKVEVLTELGNGPDPTPEIEHLKADYPDDPRVARYYANLMWKMGTPEEALAAFDSALKVTPDDMQLHQRRADVLERLGRADDAIAELDLVIDTWPNDPPVLFRRAELELALGNASAAIADAERAKAAHYETDKVYVLLAQANLVTGDLDKALEAISAAEAMTTIPQSDMPVLSLYRFSILYRLGRKEEAEIALAGFAKERREHVLKVQVFLRNMGFEDVQISGTFDEIAKQRLTACLVKGACGGPLSKFI